MTDQKIAVMGMGGLGGVIAGALTAAGHDVTAVDAWSEHVDAARRHGLRVARPEGDLHVHLPVLHIHEVQAIRHTFDLVILATKAYDTAWATTLMRSVLHRDGAVATVQNGINEPTIAELVGVERTLGIVTLMGAACPGPGLAERTDTADPAFLVGDPRDGSPRRESLVALLNDVASTVLTDNLWGERWTKLALNCMVNPLSAMSGLSASEARLDPDCQRLGIMLGAEVVEVARAAGVDVAAAFTIPADDLLRAARTGEGFDDARARIADGAQSRGGGLPSMLQDVLKGRRCEVNELNGYASRMGREHAVATPFNDAVVSSMNGLGPSFMPHPGLLEPLIAFAREHSPA